MRSTSSVVKNTQKYGYSDLVRMDASVVPKIALPALALTLWFWEARRLWGILFSHTRNLTRFIWVHCPVTEEHDVYNKYAVTNLILAYAVSVKHHLREESGHKFEDLHNLLIHLPDYRPGTFHPPLEISHWKSLVTFLLTQSLVASEVINQSAALNVAPIYLISLLLFLTPPLLLTHHFYFTDQADIPTFTAMTVAISGMVDCLSNFERIRNCPIPLAYSIHLKQTLFVYLLALPFQLVIGMGWATIPIVAVASFTLLGIEAIGGEIENPFGYDPNDLRVDQFCDEIRRELAYVMEHPTKADPSQWDRPVSLTDPMYGTFVQLNYKRNAAHKSS
ncbi:hypothetical protein BSLG_000031 [Batrachochytrium salamandrivorans]|nr:hypothetical protein BSLG_000031 [Batrachochytrium salamandrivorans]